MHITQNKGQKLIVSVLWHKENRILKNSLDYHTALLKLTNFLSNKDEKMCYTKLK